MIALSDRIAFLKETLKERQENKGNHQYTYGGLRLRRLRNRVNKLFKDVPESPRKSIIKQEALKDLEEKVFDLMGQVKAEEDAQNKAIVEVGNSEDLTQLPHRKSRRMTKLYLEYSIWGSILIIALFILINFYYAPNVIWFIYPTFAVLCWPLTMYFRWMKMKKGWDKGAGTMSRGDGLKG
jgi:hypothetical protein